MTADRGGSVAQEMLEVPVVLGDIALAPTTELAGLAELRNSQTLDDRIEILARVAAALRDEDRIRDQVSALRAGDDAIPLPHRR
jgi:hypothetical protein